MFAKVAKKAIAVTMIGALALSVAVVDQPADQTKAATKKITLKQGAHKKFSKSVSVTKGNDSIITKYKSNEIVGCKQGTATLKSGGTTYKVTVKKRPKGTVIYNMARDESAKDKVPPVKCTYESWRNASTASMMHIFTGGGLQGYGKYAYGDYRGRKLQVTINVKNSGKRTWPELGVEMNTGANKAAGIKASYPFLFHMWQTSKLKKKALSSAASKKQHASSKNVVKAVKKGKSYAIKFTYKLPAKALNPDKDGQGVRYPIYIYIPTLNSKNPYKKGDAVTITGCTIKLAS